TNLVGNAIKFTSTGSVTVAVDEIVSDKSRNERRLRFSVIDTGIGIPEQKQEKLFVKFSQVDASTTREYGGTGLGLALCKEIVSLMDGSISCVSLPRHGSTFSFDIPIPAEKPTVLQARHATVEAPGTRILLAGASDGLAGVIGCYAESMKASTIGANDIHSVRNALSDGSYDVILIDGRNGTSSASEILELTRTLDDGNQPVFFIEGTPGQGSSLQLGDDEIITRPFGRAAFDKIAKRIKSASRVEAPVQAASVSPEGNRRLRILMAEDNPANQRVATALLKSAGFTIDIANNGRIAIERAMSVPYDIVLMDVQMPIMDGLTATRRLRQEVRLQHLPIVGLTAGALEGDREKCLDAGMNDYLSKPVDWDALLSMLTTIEKELYGAAA
ncbi:MAG: response regulator, partial [Hyphomicrobiaceae bacterium]